MKNRIDGEVAVLGAGAWGTTLALHLARLEHRVRLWEIDAHRAEEMARTRLSLPFLPEHPLPHTITVTADLRAAVDGAKMGLVVVPSHVLRSLGEEIRRARTAGLKRGPTLWVSATKGLEEGTGCTPTRVLSQSAGLPAEAIVVLAGPSLAAEVAAQLPAAVLAAAADEEAARVVQEVFSSPSLRVYTNPDPLGVELGVSLKNVIAIAAGITEGLGLGQNTMGALLTRGLAEITRLGLCLGARRETFLGLAGIGDLVTTCTSHLSRNHQVGLGLAQGRALPQILEQMVMVAEGVRTTRSAWELGRSLGVEMPITDQVYAVLYEGKNARKALADLMNRPPKQEFWGEKP